MPEISYDRQSFSIDGRRVWLVCGSLDYTATPRGLWQSRLRAAKQAGLNCIATSVVWNAHERQPGVFDFEGERDLRAFVRAVAEQGLYCILRPGPYIGSGWDFGGLPAYLHGVSDKAGAGPRPREDEPLFMEAAGRYLREVFEQVGDLQVTGKAGGPIVLMQVEHQWFCDHPAQGAAYLERLVSVMRQLGCAVPIVNNNNLWQPVAGTIDTWSGGRDLPAMARQLAHLQPDAPAMVMDLLPEDAPGSAPGEDGPRQAYRLAALLGVGAQFNINPFQAGGGPWSAADAAAQGAAPLGQAGERGPVYDATKRLCTFASQFGHVLAAAQQPPAPAIALGGDHPTALLHLSGNQGALAMLLKAPQDKTQHTELMLPNGLKLDIPHAGQNAAWALLDTPLGGVATLDYTSLSPWALIGKSLLVVFGPAGAQGVVSIDGQHHAITVPTGKPPVVIEGDPVHIVVLNQEQIDAACIAPHGLIVGCNGLDDTDKPLPRKGWGTQFVIATDGGIRRKRVAQPKPPAAPQLSRWQTLSLKPLIDGRDEQYQPIDGPCDMAALGQAFGYGWYRFKTPRPVRDKVFYADGGDRLHVYSDRKLVGLLGKGFGAEALPATLGLEGDTVVLADNLGRNSAGQELGTDRKGLAGHLYTVKPIKAGKPERIKQPAGDPFAVAGYAHLQRAGVRPMSQALVWTIKPEARKPIIMELRSGPGHSLPSVISVNGEPVRFDAAEGLFGHTIRMLLDPAGDGPMTGGKNTITLQLLKPPPAGETSGEDIERLVRFYQTTGQATPKEGWAFTPWSIPSSDDAGWRAIPKTLPRQPAWLRCSFNTPTPDTPLWFEPVGLSKGQLVLNGHNLGRYWAQTRDGKQVNAGQRLYLPEPWLNRDAPNELMIFDEHGRTPGRARLVCSTTERTAIG